MVKQSLGCDDDARATRRRRILASLPDDMTLFKLASLDLDAMSLPDDDPAETAAWKQQVI